MVAALAVGFALGWVACNLSTLYAYLVVTTHHHPHLRRQALRQFLGI
jgi:hypothetical protein